VNTRGWMGNGCGADTRAASLSTTVVVAAGASVQFFCMCAWLWYARTQSGRANSTIVLNVRRTVRSTRWGQKRKRTKPMR